MADQTDLPPRRMSLRWSPLCLVMILLVAGCSTPFSAVTVNPLRPASGPEWDGYSSSMKRSENQQIGL